MCARDEQPMGDAVTLEYDIEQGPPSRLEVSGFELPGEVRRRIVERWTGAVFDGFLERDVAILVRDYLYQEGRLGATVTAAIGGDEASRTLRVVIDPGPVTMPRLQVEGNKSIATERITAVVESLGPLTAWLDAMATSLAIERLYQQEGLLSAEADVLAPEIQGDLSVVRVVIREGDPWQIGRVTLGGAEALPGGGSSADLGIAPGSRYDPRVITEAVAGLEQRFRNEGFLDVRVESETVLDHAATRADVHVLVAPGPRSILASVTIEGARPDDPTIVRSLNVPVGTPIDASAINAARRRLYETGAYRSVEIALEPESGIVPSEPVAGDRRVVARVRVEERPRYSFRYGLSVNSDEVSPDERDTQARVRRRRREPQPVRPGHDRRSVGAPARRSECGARVPERQSLFWVATAVERLSVALQRGCRLGRNHQDHIGCHRNQRRTDLPAAAIHRRALRLRSWPEPDND